MKEKKFIVKCMWCGRKLKNEKSVILGYGATCYKKFNNWKQYKSAVLFDINKK